MRPLSVDEVEAFFRYLGLESAALLEERSRLSDAGRLDLAYHRKMEWGQTLDVRVAFRDLVDGGLTGLQARLDARWHGKAGRVDGNSSDPDPGRR